MLEADRNEDLATAAGVAIFGAEITKIVIDSYNLHKSVGAIPANWTISQVKDLVMNTVTQTYASRNLIFEAAKVTAGVVALVDSLHWDSEGDQIRNRLNFLRAFPEIQNGFLDPVQPISE